AAPVRHRGFPGGHGGGAHDRVHAGRDRLCRELTMEILLALVSGTLYASGIYLMLKRRLAQLIVGLSMMANGSNLLIFTAAGLSGTRAPIVEEVGVESADAFADPVPQSLVLTAIVIGFGVL